MFIVTATNINSQKRILMKQKFYNLPRIFESEALATANSHEWQLKLGEEWVTEVVFYDR